MDLKSVDVSRFGAVGSLWFVSPVCSGGGKRRCGVEAARERKENLVEVKPNIKQEAKLYSLHGKHFFIASNLKRVARSYFVLYLCAKTICDCRTDLSISVSRQL